ncbi:hypothetical protein O6H91_19G058600 [Diphasiastrum complanatum]|uniref:Uncharacterized protein n=1 Tax=Diphasiastrum complanatum TaxID=34168 RepID=A0ACC2AVI5_DIPCM|nr:hypothetical protein O6H91_19G058600 [Diphasiastrum complanatum]
MEVSESCNDPLGSAFRSQGAHDLSMEKDVSGLLDGNRRKFVSDTGSYTVETHDHILSDDGADGVFRNEEIPRWQDQITVRAMVVGGLLGGLFCIITHKLAFTVGILPSVNIAAGLLGFFFVKTWIVLLSKCGFTSKPFTRQENTVIQTCVIAACELAFSGGFSTYLLAMDQQSYENLGKEMGNRPEDVYQPTLRRIIPYLMVVGFIGIVTLIPLSKVMIVDYNLTYPSGTATAVLINSFHTPHGATQAKKQVNLLGKYFSISFLWSFFKWFYSGIGDSCGFDNFPTFGLRAFANKFYFDFSLTYVGVGLICPHIVTWSMLFGGIISWGMLWPLIDRQAGNWFPKDLPEYDFGGLNGYRVRHLLHFHDLKNQLHGG